MKLVKNIKLNKEREIQILNHPFIQYGEYNDKTKNEKYIDILPKSFEHKVYDLIFEKIDNKHDGIFLLRAGLGEAYLLNFFIEDIIKKRKIKNPCFICHRKQYKELFSLFHPNIPFYYIDINLQKLFHLFEKRWTNYMGKKININPSTLKEVQILFNNYEKEIEKRHYTEVIKKFNNVKKFNFKSPILTGEIKRTALEKIQNLDINNFIFIINKANFVVPLEDNFWNNLTNQLREKGYDIYINDTDLTFSEAFYIASLSKGIIGLRCGFSELLSTLDVPKHIIYTPCKHNNIQNLQEILTLEKYPFVNKETLFEYNALKTELQDISNKILGGI